MDHCPESHSLGADDRVFEEMTWANIAPDNNNYNVQCRGRFLNRVPRSMGFKALGCQVTFNGGNREEHELRIAWAWLSFSKYHDILCNEAASFKKRAAFLQMMVGNVFFWCSGSWALTNEQLSELRGVQNRMLRKMIGCRDQMHEGSVEDHLKSANRTIRALKCKHRIVDWDIQCMQNHFGWAGYVSRLSSFDPGRVTLQILRFKDYEWLKLVESNNAGRQLHGRYLRVWRWEYPLAQYAKYVGVDCWHQLAVNKRSWIENLETMARWFRVNRATKL